MRLTCRGGIWHDEVPMHNLRQKRAGCLRRGEKGEKYQTQAQWTVDFHAESLFVQGRDAGGLARTAAKLWWR